MRISPSTLVTISSISFGGLHIRFSYRAVPGSRHSRNVIAAYWGSQLTYLISVLNLSKNTLSFSQILCLVLNRAAMSLFCFRLQKYWEMKIRLRVLKFAINCGLRSWNHPNAGQVRLEGKSLHINFSLVASTDISCLYPLIWSTESAVPLYFSNVGVTNLLGFSAAKMSSVNEDFSTFLSIYEAISQGPVCVHCSIIWLLGPTRTSPINVTAVSRSFVGLTKLFVVIFRWVGVSLVVFLLLLLLLKLFQLVQKFVDVDGRFVEVNVGGHAVIGSCALIRLHPTIEVDLYVSFKTNFRFIASSPQRQESKFSWLCSHRCLRKMFTQTTPLVGEEKIGFDFVSP